MAEHEVTEAMVATTEQIIEIVAEIEDLIGFALNLSASEIQQLRKASAIHVAARTTPQPTDASAASGALGYVTEDAVTALRSGQNRGEVISLERVLRYTVPIYTHLTGAGADADWVLVPTEPTQAMIMAALKSGFEGQEEHVRQDWAAMIAAASSPQQRAGDGG